MKVRLLLLAFMLSVIPSLAERIEITRELLSDMRQLEMGAAHLHGRLVTSSPGYTNDFVSPLTDYHSALGLSEVEFATALFRYAQENIHGNTNLEYVVIALRALAATPETNTLPLVEALAQEELPQRLVLPVASLLMAKKSPRLAALSAPLVERMTPLERKCFAISTTDSEPDNHIETTTADEGKSNGMQYTLLFLLVVLGGATILAFRNRSVGS